MRGNIRKLGNVLVNHLFGVSMRMLQRAQESHLGMYEVHANMFECVCLSFSEYFSLVENLVSPQQTIFMRALYPE